MDALKQARLNELAKDFTQLEVRRQMMQEFGDSKAAFSGVNEDGEDVLVSIANDSIVVSTNQKNGWIRKNTYDADGYDEGETFEGRWDR